MIFLLLCIAAVKLHIIGANCRLFLNLLVPTQEYEDLIIPKTLSIADHVDLKCLKYFI